MPTPNFADIQAAYGTFPTTVKSLMLSTVTTAGQPQASYAPFVMTNDSGRSFYVFVSGLSSHTANLKANPQAGILLIQDEANTTQIFARQRLMYDCQVAQISPQDPQWTAIADRFQVQFGALIEMLRQMPDFQIFRLVPQSGRFVLGFGAAYEVDPDNIGQLLPPQEED
ncbi:MAG: HugZ family protein [Leptolyngbyaceae cyanobacterium]